MTLRPIPDAPGYFAGDDGAIYSTRGRVARRALRGRPHHRTGHLRVRLYGPTFPARQCADAVRHYADRYVHVLICHAWHGAPPFGGALSCHKNGRPTDNRPCNLRWGSHGDNAADRATHADADAYVEALHREGMRRDDGPGARKGPDNEGGF